MKLLQLFLLAACAAESMSAHTVVVSNLPSAGDSNYAVADATGRLLPVGTIGKVGSFTRLSDIEIRVRATSAGLPGLMTAFTSFADFSVGSGAEESPGQFEIACRRPLSGHSPLIDLPIYVVLLNTLASSEASECVVLKFPARFAADAALGLDRQTALHLSQATVLFGTLDELRFNLEISQTSPFADWAAAMIGNTEADERAVGDDPDADGISNVDEFVGGTDPTFSETTPMLVSGPLQGNLVTVYLRCVAQFPGTVELLTSTDLSEEWTVATAVPEMLPDPAGQPGMGLFQFKLPAPTRLFVRPRVTLR